MVATTITITGVKEAVEVLNRLGEGAEAAGRTVIRVGATAHYAGYVERGTRRMKARPFLAPALGQAERSLRVRLIEAMPKGAARTVYAMQNVANEVKVTAQKLAPVRTGNLRSSIYTSTTGRR